MKGRFELIEKGIYDNKNKCYYEKHNLDRLVDLCNEQNKKIKELEEQLSIITMCHSCNILEKELKQARNSKAIEMLELVKKYNESLVFYSVAIDNFIADLIKELEVSK